MDFKVFTHLSFDEILAILVSVGTFSNIVLYLGDFIRRLENKFQDEASKQNTRITKLEGQVDALINH